MQTTSHQCSIVEAEEDRRSGGRKYPPAPSGQIKANRSAKDLQARDLQSDQAQQELLLLTSSVIAGVDSSPSKRAKLYRSGYISNWYTNSWN